MKLLLVSATQQEVEPTLAFLEAQAKVRASFRYSLGNLEIDVLITGVGIPATMYALMKYLHHNKTDHIVNAGIAGSFRPSTPLGKVYLVDRQRFGDLGIQEGDGTFKDLFDAKLEKKSQMPYTDGWLQLPKDIVPGFLDTASSITVNKVLGTKEDIQRMIDKYDPDLESMEGAAVAYVCLMESLPYLEIRAVSNIVEERNKEKWDIPLAIKSLNSSLQSMLTSWKDISFGTPSPTG